MDRVVLCTHCWEMSTSNQGPELVAIKSCKCANLLYNYSSSILIGSVFYCFRLSLLLLETLCALL